MTGMFTITSNELMEIFSTNKRVAVVGLSNDPMRPSYFAGKYLQEHGFDIVPVNPNYQEILGEPCYPDLLSIPGKVDIVDLFQKPDRVKPGMTGKKSSAVICVICG